MSNITDSGGTSRRQFLTTLAVGAGAVGAASLPFGFASEASAEAPRMVPHVAPDNPDALFANLNGTHRAVFDVFEPHGAFPFIGPRVFLLTNAATGTPAKDVNVVVVLRHDAVPFALNSDLWAKYKLGEMMKIDDPAMKAPATRNIFSKPGPTDFVVPPFGRLAIGIEELQADGVMFVACDAALSVHSAMLAQHTNQDQKAVKQEFLASLVPGVHPVPSGVWALGRAQKHGCAYCFGY